MDLSYASQEVEITNQTTGVKCEPNAAGQLPVLAGQTGTWTVGVTGTVPLPTGAATLAGQTAGNATLTAIKAQTDLITFETGDTGATGAAGLNVFNRCDMQSGFAPDPYFQPIDSNQDGRIPISTDSAGHLAARAQVTCDEGSFRDDFGGTSLTQVSTGTAVFTNGSIRVTGTGFLAEGLNRDWYIRATAHADTMFTAIAQVESDTVLYLTDPYPGANAASSTYTKSLWIPTIVGAGSTSVNTSILSLVGTTTTGTATQVVRLLDYGPLTFYCRASLSQRIANQMAAIGFSEGDNAGAKAYVSFTGTVNTQCTLTTANSSNAADVQTTLVTLPNGLTTATMCDYRIEQRDHVVRLFINNQLMATHRSHVPGPYDTLHAVCVMSNTGVAASATTLRVDTVFLHNFNSQEVNITSIGQKPSTESVSVTLAQDQDGIAQTSNLAFAGTATGSVNSTAETNFFLLRNPAESGKNLYLRRVFADTTTVSNAATYRAYFNPTSISGGTAVTAVNRYIGSTVASVMTMLYGVNGAQLTATVAPTRKLFVCVKVASQDTVDLALDGQIVLAPGNDIIFTVVQSVNGTAHTLTVWWLEIPVAQ
jgi:hypothetical protein